ncbi:hypothetical protein LTR85_006427 [Meristemomyces frigidus]|nr:hypothetical protein LTR85_006427 [Meristemomyces frigidus]
MADSTSDTLLASISSPSRRPAKRPKVTKVTRACDRCKARKRRCDGELPCSVCSATGSQCTYNASYTRGKLVTPRASHGPDEGLEPPNPATAAFGPAVSPALRTTAVTDDEAVVEGGQYAGPSSAYAFLKRAWERFGRKQADQTLATATGVEDAGRDVHVLSYGDRQLAPVATHDVEFPARIDADSLVATYFDFAMPTYRFLHRQTVEEWLADCYSADGRASSGISQLSSARQAIVLMVLATALLFNAVTARHVEGQAWRDSEWLCQCARQRLAEETGKTRLESVQARLAVCLYLLHTSRPNEAWYAFGTTTQMSLALGIHRASPCREKETRVIQECRKRSFWAVATLDVYLSVMLGRPPLLHADDFDQQYPEDVDDEELVSKDARAIISNRDSVEKASILHSKLARIVRKAARAQASASLMPDLHKIEAADKASDELAHWNSSLPVVLSGVVHASSLIPVFRRQIVILRLAHAHASMLISRPMLLMDSSLAMRTQPHVEACLTSAKMTLDMLSGPASDGPPFAAFWFTQYVAFNAVSIVYVWLIQRKPGRLNGFKPQFGDEELLHGAEAVQRLFADATQMNAPSLRYNVVLEELQQEAHRSLEKAVPTARAQQPHHPFTPTARDSVARHPSATAASEAQLPSEPSTLDMDMLGTDMPLDPDLWLQLDSFPFCWSSPECVLTKTADIEFEGWISQP